MHVQVWSTKLETKAQQWADGCIYKHSPDVSGEDIGENIAYSSDTDLLNEEQVYICIAEQLPTVIYLRFFAANIPASYIPEMGRWLFE